MADTVQTDLVVLGGGPGGYAAAFLAADKGMQTALIDATAKPGGTCLHVGCIPSKALLHAAHVIHSAHDATDFGIKYSRPEIDLAKLRAKRFKITDLMASSLLDGCKKRGIPYINGRGTFTDANTIQVANGPTVRFKNAIIATGSVPARLPTFDLKSNRIWDSTGALELESVPKSLLVVGGGYIGLELGSVYAALGSAVTVVEVMGGLLPGVDEDLVAPLAKRLKGQFKAILLNTKVTKVEEVKDGIRATFDGDVAEKQQTFDRVLVSVGRRPNAGNIGLDKLGVEMDQKGFIKVNEQRRTNVPNLFAIGDVAGEPMLAHKASHEGKVAVEVLTGEPAVWDPRAIPAVVFTDPEIAWAGLTETEAKKHGREVKVGKFPWAYSGRATTLGRSDGLTKVLTDPKTDRVLGIGLVGPGAGELVAEAVVAIEMGATAVDLAMCIHPHPTLSETVMEAAEVLHGLSTHLYTPRKKVL
jgi:dihydrolipoamide dehydrogenase